MSLAWQSVSPYVSIIACVAFYGRLACLRRLPFLFRQEREERTNQGGGRFRISPPALDLNKGCQFHGIAAQLAIKLSQPTGLLCPSFKRPKGVIPLLDIPEMPPTPAG